MRYVFLFSLLFSAFHTNLTAQEWVELRKSGANIQEIEDSFKAHWDGEEIPKGQGHKQFHRWFNFNYPRAYPSGDWNSISKTHADAWTLLAKQKKKNTQKDAGNWQALGPQEWINSSYAPGNGRINLLVPHPTDPNILFAGAPSGGLWKSEDEGSSWTPLSDMLATLGISGIAIHPVNPDIIYIGTGDGDGYDSFSIGVLRSEDGGETWNTTGLYFPLDQNIRMNKLVMSPSDPNVLFAASSEGLFKTTNGGITWTEVLGGNIRDVEFKPEDAQVIYASRDRFFRSDDGGENFEYINENLPTSSSTQRIAIGVSEANPDVVYLLISADSGGGLLGVYRSNDTGITFELQADSPNILSVNDDGSGSTGQGWYDLAIAVDPENIDHVFFGGINLWESYNGGQTFTLNAKWFLEPGMPENYIHADVHDLLYIEDKFYACTDGGIWRSSDNGNSFVDRSNGLEISQCYRLGISQESESRVLTGLQDNGTMYFEDGSWTHVQGADGMETFVHPTDNTILYASTQYGGLYKSTNGGATFAWTASGIGEDGVWTVPWEMSQSDPETLYVGFQNMWRSTNGGGSWQILSNDISSPIYSIGVCPSGEERMFASSSSTLFRSENSGANWEEIGQELPNLFISDILCHPTDNNLVWICFSGYDEGNKVFFSEDGGSTWSNIGEGLPNIPTNCLAWDEAQNTLYVGTDLGVYIQHPELANWQSFMSNLPNVIVNELEINTETSQIFAATFGRGIWVSETFTGVEGLPIADFGVSNSHPCAGEIVTFTDESIDHTPQWLWSFPGGTPVSSTDQHPEVNYLSPGNYEVSLTVYNAFGEATEVKSEFIHVQAQAGEENFQEGFEYPDEPTTTWDYTSSLANGWEWTNAAAYTGERCMYIENASLDEEYEFEMVSPVIDLSITPEGYVVELSFKWAYAQMHEDNDDRLRVYFSDDCGESWSLGGQWRGTEDLPSADLQLNPFIPIAQSEWSSTTVVLDEDELSENFRLKFWFRTDNGNNLFLDDINIVALPIGIESHTLKSFTPFPNPTERFIRLPFTEDIQSIQVSDLFGRNVPFQVSGKSPGEWTEIDLADVSGGTYLCRAKTNGKLRVYSIIVW